MRIPNSSDSIPLSKNAGILDSIYRSFEGLTKGFGSYHYQVNKHIDDAIVPSLQAIEKRKRKVVDLWMKSQKSDKGTGDMTNSLDDIHGIFNDIISSADGLIDDVQQGLSAFREPLAQNSKTNTQDPRRQGKDALDVVRAFRERMNNRPFREHLAKICDKTDASIFKEFEKNLNANEPRSFAKQMIQWYSEISIPKDVDDLIAQELDAVWAKRMKGMEVRNLGTVADGLRKLLSYINIVIDSSVHDVMFKTASEATLTVQINQNKKELDRQKEKIIEAEKLFGQTLAKMPSAKRGLENFTQFPKETQQTLLLTSSIVIKYAQEASGIIGKMMALVSTENNNMKKDLGLIKQFYSGAIKHLPQATVVNIETVIGKSPQSKPSTPSTKSPPPLPKKSSLRISSHLFLTAGRAKDLLRKLSSDLSEADINILKQLHTQYAKGMESKNNLFSILKEENDFMTRRVEKFSQAAESMGNAPAPGVKDKDEDGVPDAPDKDGDGVPDAPDKDGDGVPDAPTDRNIRSEEYGRVRVVLNTQISTMSKSASKLVKELSSLEKKLGSVDNKIKPLLKFISKPSVMQYINMPSFFKKERMQELGWAEGAKQQKALTVEGFNRIVIERGKQIGEAKKSTHSFIKTLEDLSKEIGN